MAGIFNFLVFNPRDLYYQGRKIITIILVLIIIIRVACHRIGCHTLTVSAHSSTYRLFRTQILFVSFCVSK